MEVPRIKLLRFLVGVITVGVCCISSAGFSQTLPMPRSLITFSSPEGKRLFLESQAREDYWPLSTQFITQDTQSFCGVASMVMVLNSLEIPAPPDPRYSPYRVFTQDNFFNNEQTRNVLSPEIVKRQGMTLDQLGQLLSSYPVEVKVYHAAETNLNDFRRLMVENLQNPNNFVLINYLRKAIEQERGGHISPIAAYHQPTDRFLILDVSRYKYPPVWVKTAALWQAIATVDPVSGKTRGFVAISRKAQPPANPVDSK